MLPRKICKLREEVFEMEDVHATEVEHINEDIKKLSEEYKSVCKRAWNNKNDIEQLEARHRRVSNERMASFERNCRNSSYIRGLSDLKRKEGECNQEMRDMKRLIVEKERDLRNNVTKHDSALKRNNERIARAEKRYVPDHKLKDIYAIRTEQSKVEMNIRAIKESIERKKAEMVNEIAWERARGIGWKTFYVLCALAGIALMYDMVYGLPFQ
ncbi:hypothetical protein HK407_09g13560 [Ordospora pajunii]|uniref:uncharacterized protein n=1 Tax=Ordospora pajunii TaxID=3039483 RepID=UPI0029526B55|nr:uncharacterized protein HK407_09g13560 [Ordospora pajunii]KAH9410943.1 hypothetical protein HK407_09g13560 [Ordospora pajunii]